MKNDQLEVKLVNPLNCSGDGIFHPTTCSNVPDGEWIEGLLEQAGEAVLTELQNQQPLRIGNVHVTDESDLSFKRIVHLPIQTAPDAPTTEDNIQIALRSGLVAVDESPVRELIIPRLLPESGIEDVQIGSVCRTVIHDILQYPPQYLQKITFADESEEWIESIRRSIEESS